MGGVARLSMRELIWYAGMATIRGLGEVSRLFQQSPAAHDKAKSSCGRSRLLQENVSRSLKYLESPRGLLGTGSPESQGTGGAKQKFESMVEALSGDLYRYAFSLCRNPTLSDDRVQETFMRAWRNLSSLRDDRKAKSWLITT